MTVLQQPSLLEAPACHWQATGSECCVMQIEDQTSKANISPTPGLRAPLWSLAGLASERDPGLQKPFAVCQACIVHLSLELQAHHGCDSGGIGPVHKLIGSAAPDIDGPDGTSLLRRHQLRAQVERLGIHLCDVSASLVCI